MVSNAQIQLLKELDHHNLNYLNDPGNLADISIETKGLYKARYSNLIHV